MLIPLSFSQPAMEALSFQRLQRAITSISTENRGGIVGGKQPEEDEEDSFFELELTVLDSDPKFYAKIDTAHLKDKPNSRAFVSSFSVETKQSTEKTQNDLKCNFSQSKRKILPIESSFPRPQSPISLLKSAPKLRVLMFRKSTKSASAHEAEKTEGAARHRNRGRKFFTLRFKLKEIEPALTRGSSLRKNGTGPCSDSPSHGESNSKRFSKELIQKYLRLVKPLHVKVSKKQTGGARFTGQFSPTASLSTAPVGSSNREQNAKAPAGFRVVACRQLGKSKSASASVAGIMSPARRDDSLLQQHDGIESAILHCKRSFSSSRELMPLSPSTSVREKSQSIDSARSSSDATSMLEVDRGILPSHVK